MYKLIIITFNLLEENAFLSCFLPDNYFDSQLSIYFQGVTLKFKKS